MLLLAAAAGALLTGMLVTTRPGLAERVPLEVRWAAAAAAAAALALGDAAPTGWEPLDLVLRASFGFVVPLAAARAGTVATAWLLLVAAATCLVALDAPSGPSGLALGVFLALAAAGSATPTTAAVAAALAIAPLGFVDWPIFTGAGAAAVTAAALPVLLAGAIRSGGRARRGIGWALAVGVLIVVAGSAAGLLAAFSAESDITQAVDLATDGIERLGDEDEAAQRLLRDAAGGFESAEQVLTSWWARAALLVPGVAQQTRAVSTMASAGAELSRTAADASEDADVDGVRPVDGRIDLDALAALAQPLDRAVSSLRRAEERLAGTSSPLLLEPVAERLRDLRDEITRAAASAELASQAVTVAPRMLGADGPRRYFLAFQNPAELRGNGGFVGNWAEVVADSGELTLTRNGRIRELVAAAPPLEPRVVEGEAEVFEIWGPQAAAWENMNLTPDHPTMGRLVAQMYPRSGGAPIDGVIALTPVALSGFLELTGPIDAPGYPEPLSSENVARVLLHEQYLTFPGVEGGEREDFLRQVVDTLFDRLTTGELPGPRTIAAELGPAVASRHLQLWAADGAEQNLFEAIGADGASRRVSGDGFGIATQNLGANKIDWFLHRSTEHDVTWNPATGEVEGTITVTLRNDAPSSGLPRSVIGFGDDLSTQGPTADGENRLLATIYSGIEIGDVTLDGMPVPVERFEELGYQAVRLQVSVPSESARVVVASLRGVVEPSSGYRVRPVLQATANPDRMTSSVSVAGPWTVRAVTGGTSSSDRKRALSRADAPPASELTLTVRPASGALSPLERLRGDG